MRRKFKLNFKIKGGVSLKFNVKKAIPVLLAGTILAVSFTGCQNKAKQTTSGNSSSSTEKTVVSVWTQNRADATFITPKIDEFNKSNKDNVTIDYKMYTDNFSQAIDMAFASNSAPDLVSESGIMSVFTKYVSQGQYIPIDKYLSAKQKEEYTNLKMNGVNMYDNKIYYLPIFGTTGRLFYNKDIFSKAGISNPPATLSEMVADAKKISDSLKGQNIYGFAMNLKSPASALQRSLDFIVERSGGPEQGYDFKAGQYDFSAYKPYIEQLRALFAAGVSFPGCESLDIDPLRTQFAAGKIGMYISWSHADPGVYQSQFPTTQNWSVAQLPTLNCKVYSQNIQPYGGLMITKGSKNYDADWKVLNDFFYNDDFDKAYHEAGLAGLLAPALQAKATTPSLLKGKEEDLLSKNDKLWPATPQAINDQAVVVEGNDQYTTFLQLILGKGDIDSTLSDLTKRYNDAYQKGISAGKGSKVQLSNFDPANPTAAK
jgi:multiple sugar transport system substrate-binding protein